MNMQLFEVGSALGALVLIGWSVTSFMNGTALATGAVIREALADSLASVRSSTSMTRAELADASLLFAVGAAVVGVVLEQSLMLAVVAALLWVGRPQVVKSLSQENPMMAISGTFTSDLVIGVFTPLFLAQLLTQRFAFATVLFSLLITFSWPAGGAGRQSDGPWVPAWR